MSEGLHNVDHEHKSPDAFCMGSLILHQAEGTKITSLIAIKTPKLAAEYL
jgi:hypothetical protein